MKIFSKIIVANTLSLSLLFALLVYMQAEANIRKKFFFLTLFMSGAAILCVCLLIPALDICAATFGVLYALVTALFYSYIIDLLAQRSVTTMFSGICLVLTVALKGALLIFLFYWVKSISENSFWSALLGFSIILFAGFVDAAGVHTKCTKNTL